MDTHTDTHMNKLNQNGNFVMKNHDYKSCNIIISSKKIFVMVAIMVRNHNDNENINVGNNSSDKNHYTINRDSIREL